MDTRSGNSSRKRGIAFAQLLVVLLAWSQVALAAHQFEHAVSDLDDFCAVCVQLDRSGDACPPSVAASLSSSTLQDVVRPASEAAVVRFAAPYQSRASP